MGGNGIGNGICNSSKKEGDTFQTPIPTLKKQTQQNVLEEMTPQ